MSFVDDLLALGRSQDPALKPIEADLVDVVAGLAKKLEDLVGFSGSLSQERPPNVAAPATVDSGAATPPSEEPPTVGSMVADVARSAGVGSFTQVLLPDGGIQPDAVFLPTSLYHATVEELTAELARRQSEAIQQADAQRTTVT